MTLVFIPVLILNQVLRPFCRSLGLGFDGIGFSFKRDCEFKFNKLDFFAELELKLKLELEE